MIYRCSECRRTIGAMLDKTGGPVTFLCPHANRPAELLIERGWSRHQ